jgi:hypothetical protein
MGKKSRAKKARRDGDQGGAEGAGGAGGAPGSTVQAATELLTGRGDLRLVGLHIEEWLKGRPEADVALMALGRDASFEVLKVADDRDDERLRELGKKLVARKPTVETNLFQLREASVLLQLEAAKKTAKPALETPAFAVDSPSQQVVVFDPLRLKEVLVKGGRPRVDAKELGAGTLACLKLPALGAKVRFTSAPHDGPSLELRLGVDSGVVFVGPPEAADGPRLGTVRLDPFRTQLDECLSAGTFVRLGPGHFAVHARNVDGELVLSLQPAADMNPIRIDPAALQQVPG